jgi:hypothetical protein
MQRSIIKLSLGCFIVVASTILSGCTGGEEAAMRSAAQPVAEKPIPTLSPAVTSAPPKAEAALPPLPPQPDEVRRAVERVYKQTVIFDANRPDHFVQGDFNGDGLADIAAVVKPAEGMLAELNHELAAWLRGDPQKARVPDFSKAVMEDVPKPEPAVIRENDTLLAVIHGYGPTGWRNPEAKQSYLLRNAAGRNMTVQDGKSIFAALKSKEKYLRIQGDVIRQRLSGQVGFLYYTGAKYAWHH